MLYGYKFLSIFNMPNEGLLKECKVKAGTIIKGNFNISPSLDLIGLISQK